MKNILYFCLSNDNYGLRIKFQINSVDEFAIQLDYDMTPININVGVVWLGNFNSLYGLIIFEVSQQGYWAERFSREKLLIFSQTVNLRVSFIDTDTRRNSHSHVHVHTDFWTSKNIFLQFQFHSNLFCTTTTYITFSIYFVYLVRQFDQVYIKNHYIVGNGISYFLCVTRYNSQSIFVVFTKLIWIWEI